MEREKGKKEGKNEEKVMRKALLEKEKNEKERKREREKKKRK